MKKNSCQHCGALMMAYKHSFNKNILACLKKLYEASDYEQGFEEVSIKSLNLTNPQYSNFPKLKYWDLAEQVKGEEGRFVSGEWRITPRGIDFIEGRTLIPDHVMIYRNRIVKESEIKISYKEVVKTHQTKEEHIRTRMGLSEFLGR